MTVCHLFLARAVECAEICCSPPTDPLFHLSAQNHCKLKMASYDLRAGSSKDGCPCRIITWASTTTNMGVLPTSRYCVNTPSLFPTVGISSKDQLAQVEHIRRNKTHLQTSKNGRL